MYQNKTKKRSLPRPQRQGPLLAVGTADGGGVHGSWPLEQESTCFSARTECGNIYKAPRLCAADCAQAECAVLSKDKNLYLRTLQTKYAGHLQSSLPHRGPRGTQERRTDPPALQSRGGTRDGSFCVVERQGNLEDIGKAVIATIHSLIFFFDKQNSKAMNLHMSCCPVGPMYLKCVTKVAASSALMGVWSPHSVVLRKGRVPALSSVILAWPKAGLGGQSSAVQHGAGHDSSSRRPCWLAGQPL
jgi:hypothetical protein